MATDIGESRGIKRSSDTQLEPESLRGGSGSGETLTSKEVLLYKFIQRLAAERDAAKATAQIESDRADLAAKDCISLTERLLASDARASKASKSHKKAESALNSVTVQLRQAHARSALSASREQAARTELENKVLEVAGRAECPVCYTLTNTKGHEPYRLGCLEGHIICYECVYRMFLEPSKPSRGCPMCRHVLSHAPQLDRLLKSIVDSVLPPHAKSSDDLLRTAPSDPQWITKLSWPPTSASARTVRRGLQRPRDQIICVDDLGASSDSGSVIVIDA